MESPFVPVVAGEHDGKAHERHQEGKHAVGLGDAVEYAGGTTGGGAARMGFECLHLELGDCDGDWPEQQNGSENVDDGQERAHNHININLLFVGCRTIGININPWGIGDASQQHLLPTPPTRMSQQCPPVG